MTYQMLQVVTSKQAYMAYKSRLNIIAEND